MYIHKCFCKVVPLVWGSPQLILYVNLCHVLFTYFQRIHTKHECHLVYKNVTHTVYLSMNPFKIHSHPNALMTRSSTNTIYRLHVLLYFWVIRPFHHAQPIHINVIWGSKVIVNSTDSTSSTIKLSVYRQIEGNKHSELSIYVTSFPAAQDSHYATTVFIHNNADCVQ